MPVHVDTPDGQNSHLWLCIRADVAAYQVEPNVEHISLMLWKSMLHPHKVDMQGL